MDPTRVNEFGISGEDPASRGSPSVTQEDGAPPSTVLRAITEGPANGTPTVAPERGADSTPAADSAGLADGSPEASPLKTAEEKKKD